MTALPSALALTNIADGANIVASDHRNNYSAVQTAVNGLIAALTGGTAGQVLSALDATDVQFIDKTLQKVAYVGNVPHGDGAAAAGVGATWPTANAVILVPFTLQASQTIDRVHFLAGNVQSGNFDIGVYDSAGTRKVSKGSTAQSTLTASSVNEVTFGSTVLAPSQYYLALAADNATGKFVFQTADVAGGTGTIMSKYQLQVAASFPLPASLTPGTTHPTSALLLSAPVT